MNAALAIAVTEAKFAVEKAAGEPLADRFRAASKVTYRHWMLTDQDQQFVAACEALYALADETEKDRIKSELESLRNLAALMNGVPIDLDAMTAQLADAPERIGLRDLWIEVTQDGR